MKLKGDYNAETTYSVGDVVRYTDGIVYNLIQPCPAGTSPMNTLYWGRSSAMRAMCALMILDMMETINIPTNIDDKGIVLNSSTVDSDKQYLLNIYDPEGSDDPEITVTEITDEEEGDS